MKEKPFEELALEEGEEHLFSLINQAGNDARIRWENTLDKHFSKIKDVIKDAVSKRDSIKYDR